MKMNNISDLSNQSDTAIFERKNNLDKIIKIVLLSVTLLCSSVIIIVTVFILFKGVLPFVKDYTENGETGKASLSYFLTGLRFNNGYDADLGKYLYGVFYLVVNTLSLNLVATFISVPTAILTALFISHVAPKFLARIIQSGVDLLAGIPSVIYGVFGVGVIVPLIKSLARNVFGNSSSSGISLLSGAIILALMSMPTMISVAVTALKAVDENLIKGSLALGASKAETNFKICLRSAKSGIFAGIILGLGRALGEATAISMVCGSPTYGITTGLFDPTVTLTSQMLLSLGECIPDSLNYDIRFSAGIALMLIIIVTNLVLNDIKNHVSDAESKPLMITRAYLFIRQYSSKLKARIKNYVR